MRPLRVVLAVALAASCQASALAQISPGELSSAHASLEGIGSCTSCHELGKAVVNEKCLECHTELRTRINAGTGFHGPLAGRQCVECHKEHLGRSFAVIRFDKNSYDHSRVGFPLLGKHAKRVCEKCHASEFRKARDIQQNKALLSSHTFLGLSRECGSCHADVHKGQLNTACQQCHGLDSWKPAVAFNHDRARFPLTGKHATVECAKCHVPAAPGGPLKFGRLEFSRCSPCHADPHKGKFQKPCEACHSTHGWGEGVTRGFDHASTRFALRGAHRNVRCDRCHPPSRGAGVGQSANRFAVQNFDRCSDCHADTHRGEFAQRPGAGACETCHSETGFSPSKFDHTSSVFALQGKHLRVPCERCHPTLSAYRTAKGTVDFQLAKHDRCADCHADAHAGQLATRGDAGDCKACHTVSGYLPTTFTPDTHARTRFPLTGAHSALPCALCHVSGAVQARSTRQLRWPQAPVCETCHKDIHRNQFVGRYACNACHGTQSWVSLLFVHDRTRFPLSGKHATVPCAVCHKPTAGGEIRFAGTPIRCTDCHDATTLKAKQ